MRVAVWCCLAITFSPSWLRTRHCVADENPRTFAIRTVVETKSQRILSADLTYEARRRVSFYKPGGLEIDGKKYVHIRVRVSDEKFAQAFDVRYPFGVTEKAIVPLFGYACEIGEIRTDRRPEDGDDGEDSDDTESVQLVVTTVETLRKEFHPNQLAIPLGGFAERRQEAPGEPTHFPWQHVRYVLDLKSITTVDGAFVAEIDTFPVDRNTNGGDRALRPGGRKTLKVRQGQTFESPESFNVDKD